VRRRWIPHSEGRGISARFKKRRKDGSGKKGDRSSWLDVLDVPASGCGEDIAGLVVVAIAALLLIVLVAFGPGLILIGIDLAWLVIVFVAGLFARVVLRRPWLVEAVPSSGERRRFAVQGFRGAGRARDEIATDLAAGLPV